MAFTDLTFGKHKGKNLAKILWTDPDWFFWMYANRKFSGGILRQAQYLYPRARSIKIPKPIPSDWKVEYIVDSYDGKFSHMSIVEKDRSPHSGSSIAYYQPVIDMNFPRSMKNYDKGGYKVMIRNLKSLFFGNLSYRVTKQRAEQFFANSNNFVLGYVVHISLLFGGGYENIYIHFCNDNIIFVINGLILLSVTAMMKKPTRKSRFLFFCLHFYILFYSMNN